MVDLIKHAVFGILKFSGGFSEGTGNFRNTLCSEEKQDYKFGSMLAAYIGPLKQEVAEIKCHLPKTVVIPANDDYVRVDRSINAPYCNNFAFGAYGNPYGPFPGGGFFG